jgi:hypothetical protein
VSFHIFKCSFSVCSNGSFCAKEYTFSVDAFYDSNTKTMRDAWGKPLTGLVKSYYKSGKIWRETPYKNGEQEGLKKWHYESGGIKSEAYYKNGLKEYTYDVDAFYDDDTETMRDSRNQPLTGLVKSYYENGKIKR